MCRDMMVYTQMPNYHLISLLHLGLIELAKYLNDTKTLKKDCTYQTGPSTQMKTWNDLFCSTDLIMQHLFGLKCSFDGSLLKRTRGWIKEAHCSFYFYLKIKIVIQRVSILRDFKSSTGFLSGPSLVQLSGTLCYVLLFSPFFPLTPWGSCVDLSEC